MNIAVDTREMSSFIATSFIFTRCRKTRQRTSKYTFPVGMTVWISQFQLKIQILKSP